MTYVQKLLYFVLETIKGFERTKHILEDHLNLGYWDLVKRNKDIASTFEGDLCDVMDLVVRLIEKDAEGIERWANIPFHKLSKQDETFFVYGYDEEDDLDKNNLSGLAVIRVGGNKYIKRNCNKMVVVLQRFEDSDHIVFKTAYPYPNGYSPEDVEEWRKNRKEKKYNNKKSAAN